MPTTICIAGKNQIAVDGLDIARNRFPELRIVGLPNAGDTGEDGWQPSFRKHCAARGVEIVTQEALYGLGDLIFISLQYGEIIKTQRFRTPHLLNIHFSLLPKYKGLDTILHSLLNNETKVGATLHVIDDGIDTGPIIDQSSFAVAPDDTARDLYFRHLENAAGLLRKNIDALVSRRYSARPQGPAGACYYGRRAFDYSRLEPDFRQCAEQVHNYCRALTFPEFQLPEYNGQKIARTEILAQRSTLAPGTVVREDSTAVTIATIDYDIMLIRA